MKRSSTFNLVFFLWLAISFWFTYEVLLIFTNSAFVLTLVMYAVGLGLVFSDLGEGVMRWSLGAKPVDQCLPAERERLIPIFDQMRTLAGRSNLALYVIDDPFPGAMALGKKTVIVNHGLLPLLTDEEIAAVLAHEMAHHLNGDSVALLTASVGNFFVSSIILLSDFVVRVLGGFMTKVRSDRKDENAEGSFFVLVAFLVQLVAFIVGLFGSVASFLASLALRAASRRAEFQADAWAGRAGYSAGLISALRKIYGAPRPRGWSFASLTATHPPTAERIARLESMTCAE